MSISTNNHSLLYKIGVSQTNTPILLSINSNVDYQNHINQFIDGLFSQSNLSHYNYLDSVNTLILDATNLKRNDLDLIFNHINVSPLQKGYYKICILENIENLSPLLANALLKTIEEPLSFTYLIFTTNNIANVLSTIKSRCNTICLSGNESCHFNHDKLNELDEQQIKSLIKSFRNINSLKSWLNQEDSNDVISFFLELIKHQNEYEYLYQQSNLFSKFDYKQIRVLVNWLISYFDDKDNQVFNLIIQNFDLNLAKSYIYFCILEFLK